MFLIDYDISVLPRDYGGARCQKFNIVGADELDNLELAQLIANCQGNQLYYDMVDFHSSRPGHDLRYALDGTKMKDMGWSPSPVKDRLVETIEWALKNNRWLDI